MADQKVSNERKKELEKLDFFQENLIKGMVFLKEQKNLFFMGLGAVLLVIIVFSAVMLSIQKSEDTAALKVSRAMAKYAGFEDPNKGYLEVKDTFETVFKEYSNTHAGKQARLKFAKICYDASKFDESLIHYKEALAIFEGQALMTNFILASLGHVSISKKDFGGAAQYFQQIKESETNLLKDEAGFALAMISKNSGNIAESKKMYETIVSDHQNSIYLPIAKGQIDMIR
ncbi:MAG: tetratricopeptide repeat protein [Desulfobacterales bacterium]|nr:tetratricopeptide repeat protein [Desulfobacterales bacterium]